MNPQESTFETPKGNPKLKALPLLLFRVFVLSLILTSIAWCFDLKAFMVIGKTGLSLSFALTGLGFLFQSRRNFTPSDNFMANLVGTVCLLFGTAIFVFEWLL